MNYPNLLTSTVHLYVQLYCDQNCTIVEQGSVLFLVGYGFGPVELTEGETYSSLAGKVLQLLQKKAALCVEYPEFHQSTCSTKISLAEIEAKIETVKQTIERDRFQRASATKARRVHFRKQLRELPDSFNV